jgi:hypothetical protein
MYIYKKIKIILRIKLNYAIKQTKGPSGPSRALYPFKKKKSRALYIYIFIEAVSELSSLD